MSRLRTTALRSISLSVPPSSSTQVADLYGRWLVLGRAERPAHIKGRGAYWHCLCLGSQGECGNEKVVMGKSLRAGESQSCGCINAERERGRHGHSPRGPSSRTYHSWVTIAQRCNNPNNPRWKDYGGRGISVCERWRTFENFLEDMGERPPDRTIDRIDNDGNYEPSNCRWATLSEQARNTRRVLSSSSRYHGVSWDKKNSKWRAAVWIGKVSHHLGRHDDEEAAAAVVADFRAANGLVP